MPDIEKLPKWAQDYIHHLKAELHTAQRQLREVGGEDPTNTYTKPWEGDSIYLPNDSRVRFKVGDTNWEWIDAWITDDGLKVMAERPMEIELGASNVLIARLRSI